MPPVRSRSELSDTPSAYGVGTSGEVSFFVGNDVAVAIGIADSESGMEGHRLVGVEQEAFRKVEVELGVLRERYAEERAAALAVGVLSGGFCNAVEHISGGFHVEFQLIAVGAVECGSRFLLQ